MPFLEIWNSILKHINQKRWLWVVFFIILFLILFFSCSEEDTEKQEVRLRPIRYQQITHIPSSQQRIFTGISAASIEKTLSFKVAGTLLRLYPVVGDRVYKDQVIAELDRRDYTLRAQEGEANLEKTKSESRSAEANYKRIQALYENRNASLNELDAARASFESARASIRLLEKQLEFLKLQENYTVLTSPDDCKVADIKPKENENISAGQPVFSLACGEKTKVKVTVPEAVIGFIKQNDVVSVRFDVIPNQTFEATTLEVGVAPTEQGTTYPVTVELNEARAEVRSGMATQVTFTLHANENEKIVIPTSALANDRKGHYVFVLQPIGNDQGMVYRRAVRIGEITARGVEIIGGLKDQELIVIAGISQLQDKQKVRVPKQPGM